MIEGRLYEPIAPSTDDTGVRGGDGEKLEGRRKEKSKQEDVKSNTNCQRLFVYGTK